MVFLERFRVNLSCEFGYFVDEKDGLNWLYNYVLWASLVECQTFKVLVKLVGCSVMFVTDE